MGVVSDVAGIAPVEKVELFIWDARPLADDPSTSTDILYFHPGTTVTATPIRWQGQIYEPMPIEITGMDKNATGTLPRPTMRVSNIGGLIGAYIRGLKGGLNAKVTRKRTLGKYLDADNFPNGNPYADPTAAFPDDVFYVARKANENAIWIEMELAAMFDVAGVQLPRRQVLASVCQWVYRGEDCTYSGPPVEDIDGNPIPPSTQPDQCRKTLNACKARFGANGILRSSAFPGSLLGQAQ